uniref:Rap-GAP domain-containing protein n=1 Tax=Photinus pyralis TaxID=7054 RepID=A0A1Y1N0Q7_PHOPY
MSGNAKDTKEIKSFQDKLKQYFRTNKGNQGHRSRPDFTLTEDIERLLSSDSPPATRIRAIKELCDVVVANKLKDKVVEKLWSCLQDLFSKDQPEELRHLAFHFLQCLLKGQNERLSLMRAHFFRVVKNHDHPDDIIQRFELFQALTNYGKDACYFEEEVAPFLLKILPEITSADLTLGYLSVITTFIKFNAAYMENSISQLILQISAVCFSTSKTEVVIACIEVLDTILAYSNLPSEILPHFIAILCRTVNGEVYCQLSWQVMRNLLGTHMGHASLYTMCQMLEEPTLKQDSGLLRGAVFFINMGLWCTHPIVNLKCPPSSVLPSIQQAVESNQPIVTYEVMLSMQGLITNLGLQLHDPEWDIIITILSIIIHQIDAAPDVAPNVLVANHLHETLNTIENYIEVGSFHGSIDQFYGLIGECSLARPESSVSKLISYLAQDIIPIRHLWFSNLYNLLQKYYRQETRTNVRLKTLSVLSKVIKLNRYEYEDELIDRIVVPHLIHTAGDQDPIIRSAVAELLLDLCYDCESKRCLELLDILEKLLLRPYDQYLGDISANEGDTSDMKSLVTGLINVFAHKIYRLPSIHAVRIYMMLVTFLEHHYSKPKIFEDCYHLRYKILECFLKMRADSLYHVGCSDSNGKLKYSAYLCITYSGTERGPMGSPPPMSPAVSLPAPCIITYVPLRPAFKLIITCLKQEKDWEVLQMVLQAIPVALQNKSLILTKQGNNEVDLLVDALCAMITDRTLFLPDSLRNTVKPNRTDFHIAVLLVLASLASYHSYLDPVHQQKMIRWLVKYGLVPRCSRQCIAALTICTLEMKDVMVKLLPEVLLDLSKISSTVHIAIPVLEFLSTLTKLPDVFANFVGDQYMAVFAISLPFTNPFKYNHYIVSLAHHVIAVWFLSCRLPFRREFITYISKGLQTNVLVPFEEGTLRTDLSKLNEDSSNRKRSSSLTEQSSRRRERASTIARSDGKVTLDFRQINDRTLQTFYEELTETCQDLMARYTFSSCSALPRRSPTTEYILSGGHSTTWFLGNKLITITTSGCTQKALRNGLCDKCLTMCRLDRLKSPDVDRNIPLVGRSNSSDKDKDDSNSSRVTRQNSGEKSNNNTSTSSPLEDNKELTDKLEQLPSKLQQLMSIDGKPSAKQACVCWCQGWAEIYVRRATGDMSWIMRIQNQLSQQLNICDYPLNEILTLFTPSVQQCAEEMESTDNQCQSESVETGNPDEEFSSTASMPISIPGSPCKQSPSRQSSRDSIDEDMENIYEDGSKSRNPVRRSNSSPEMSSNWKNPFLQKQERDRDESRTQDEENTKKMKTYTKDMRVSCEAIPEEISGMGTTPPSTEPVSNAKEQHPALLSCHSYPGSTPPPDQTVASKAAHTVPPSPNIIHTTSPLTLPIMQSQNPRLSTMHSSSSKSSKSESTDSVNSEKGIERPTSLSSLPNLPPLSAKPPQSPTQTSPRLPRHVHAKDGHEIQKSSSLNLERTHSLKGKEKKSGSNEKLNQLDLSQGQKRDRGYTISVMSNIRKPRLDNLRHTISTRPKDAPKSGNIPSFVFLQLYHSAEFGSTTEKPLLVTSSQVVQRAVKVLDCIPPYETHRIGVIYVREGQCNNETEILRNPYGSVRYVNFLQNLGTLIKLQDVDPQVIFLGGLEQDGNDGKFTYIWQEDVIRVAFHVATLMPNKDSDPNCTSKKLHIGNNNVTIVYNESGEDYNINTIRGQFNFACIIVQPLDHSTNKVTIKIKDELIELMGTSEPKIISDKNVAILARQLALHADLASLVSRSLKSQSSDPYASNWLERLRKIKNVRTKILAEAPKKESGPDDGVTRQPRRMEDFSEYA